MQTLNHNNCLNNKINSEYLEPFFVGLFEGDGTMGLLKTKKGSVMARFLINLKYTSENLKMLELIKNHFGGSVSVFTTKQQSRTKVVWAATSKKSTTQILAVFKKYPPLTSRQNCRLKYLIKCYKLNYWAYYVDNRNSQYNTQGETITKLKKQLEKKLPSYFDPWLSGFIEAEGCFREKDHPQFIIGQNDDVYLIEAIRRLFKSNHKVRKILNYPDSTVYYYKIEIGGLALKRIIKHVEQNPLLGDKLIRYTAFCIRVKQIHKTVR
jgi:hypothetical protein